MSATRELARFLTASSWGDIPQPIRHEGKRAILNWLGCALGGCRDDTIERLLAAFGEFSGPRRATLIGRDERVDPLNAALINAVASNILDYDDTHLPTVIHPSVPVAAAALATVEHRSATGAQLLHAFILGIEAECRIGRAVTRSHYAAGWHITATCGVFGAAAAAGKLLQLNEQQMVWALGIASTQACGLTAMMGSMCKSYNMGHAARNGLSAALLARQGFTSAEQGIEGPRGFAHVLAEAPQLDAITSGLGSTWELSWNAYKPFPCGIVLHPVIDGCLQLRAEHDIRPGEIARIDVRSHPLALELAGRSRPSTGLEGKLSVHHAAAVALVHGKAGVPQFTDASVREAAVVALRDKLTACADASLDTMQAHVAITLADGRRFERHVPHALGTLEKPLSDAALEGKFQELAQASHSQCHVWDVIELAWMLDTLHDASELARAATPARA